MNIRKALLPRPGHNPAQQPESSTNTLYYEVAERVDLVHHARGVRGHQPSYRVGGEAVGLGPSADGRSGRPLFDDPSEARQ